MLPAREQYGMAAIPVLHRPEPTPQTDYQQLATDPSHGMEQLMTTSSKWMTSIWKQPNICAGVPNIRPD